MYTANLTVDDMRTARENFYGALSLALMNNKPLDVALFGVDTDDTPENNPNVMMVVGCLVNYYPEQLTQLTVRGLCSSALHTLLERHKKLAKRLASTEPAACPNDRKHATPPWENANDDRLTVLDAAFQQLSQPQKNKVGDCKTGPLLEEYERAKSAVRFGDIAPTSKDVKALCRVGAEKAAWFLTAMVIDGVLRKVGDRTFELV